MSKFIPTIKQEQAFNKVIEAMKAANKLGLLFYGQQFDLCAYTKEASNYINMCGFENSLRGKYGEVHRLSNSILNDSGADDIPKYVKFEDNPDNL